MRQIEDTDAMLRAVKQKVYTYSTLILGATPDRPFGPLGTGTLVRVAGRQCLLTAAHVWEAAEQYQGVALTNSSSHPSAVAVDRDYFTPRFLTPFPKGEAILWGPDLALIEIPLLYASNLEATGKAFYDLTRRRAERLEVPLDVRSGNWVIVGALFDENFTVTGPQPDGGEGLETTLTLIGSRVRSTHERRGFDCIDIALDNKLSDGFPVSYGGISGAGLWRVGTRFGEKIAWPNDGPVELEGVAFFYHKPDPEPEDEVIRCHGRRSVYDIALKGSGLLPADPPKE
jgi:hypothetical protein